MIKRKLKKSKAFNEAQTRRWLAWIATSSEKNHQAVFLIEGLQTSWLPHKRQKIAHFLLTIFFATLIIVLVFILLKDIEGGLLQATGLGIGIGLGLGVGFSLKIGEGIENNPIQVNKQPSGWSFNHFRKKFLNGVIQGLFRGAVIGLFIGIVFIFSLVFYTERDLPGQTIMILFSIPTFVVLIGLFGVIAGLISSGFIIKMEKGNSRPNEGMYQTWKGSLWGGFGGFLIGFIFGFPFGIFEGRSTLEIIDAGLYEGASLGAVVGIITAFWTGGMDLIRHYTLRLLIYIYGLGPWRMAAFLDFVVDDLKFMRHVGGGYIFIHRTMKEHFSNLESEGGSNKVE